MIRAKFNIAPYVILVCIIAGSLFIMKLVTKRQDPVNTTSQTPVLPVKKITDTKKEPIRIGIQAGHWKTDEMPDDFANIRRRGGGTEALDVKEVDINLEIANKVASLLKKQSYIVDLIPATVPVDYQADAFVAIHLDGNDYSSASGYKVAPSDFDLSGKAAQLSAAIESSYSKATGISWDDNISESMTEYYAFNYKDHLNAVSAKTPAAIIEIGYLTNYYNRRFILNNKTTVAEGIANGIVNYINNR